MTSVILDLFCFFYLITIFLSHASASSYLFNDSVVGFLQLSYTLHLRLLPRHTIFFSSWIYSQWRNPPRHVSLCLMKCKETFLSNIANSAGMSSTKFTHDCLSHEWYWILVLLWERTLAFWSLSVHLAVIHGNVICTFQTCIENDVFFKTTKLF